MYDIIGDIHGYAKELKLLLEKLGYTLCDGVYQHETRQVLFIGDYIDRGPEIKETLDIVKAMVDKGNAIALMGNHEYNAIMFHVEDQNGGHLRDHSIKNILQHYETLKAFKGKQEEFDHYIEWFKTLPLFYENEHFRAVHAAWNYSSIAFLKQIASNGILPQEELYASIHCHTPLNEAVDVTLKGLELDLPEGQFFYDNDQFIRHHIRIKWWENPAGHHYQSIAVHPKDEYPTYAIEKPFENYKPEDKPVFFGHYWLKENEPALLKPNVCCVDYSVALGQYLTAYRFEPGLPLSNDHFVFQKVVPRTEE